MRNNYLYLILIILCLTACNDEFEGQNTGEINFLFHVKPIENDSIKSLWIDLAHIGLETSDGELRINSDQLDGYMDLVQLEDTFELATNIPADLYYGVKMGLNQLPLNAEGKLQKVNICHLPPGNKPNRRTLNISACAVPAHTRNHGDFLGFCNEEDNPTQNYSYVEYIDGEINMLFSEQTEYEQEIQFDVSATSTTNVLIELDLEASLQALTRNDEAESQEYDESDDLGDIDCSTVYTFNPVYTAEVIKLTGDIEGEYTDRLSGRSDYKAFLYQDGTYSATEANRNNPFPNALDEADLDEEGKFEFLEIDAGDYEIIIAEFSRGRYRKVIANSNNFTVTGGEVTDIELNSN